MQAQLRYWGLQSDRRQLYVYLLSLAAVVALTVVTQSGFFVVAAALTVLFLAIASVLGSIHRRFHSQFGKAWSIAQASLRVKKLAKENEFLRSLVEQLEATTTALRAANAEGAIHATTARQTRHAVVFISPSGIAESINDAFTQLTGYAAQDIIGRNPIEILQGKKTNQKTVAKIHKALQQSEPVNVELLHYARDGQPFWVLLDIEPVFSNSGELQHFIATQFDISERKQKMLDLRAAKRLAEAASRSKSEFLANMSREIRTPLNGILGFTEVLRRGVGDPKQRRMHLDTIHSSGQHLMLLINDILDVSEIEAGRMQFEKTVCSPHEIICEVLTNVRDKANDKGISLECRWSGEIPSLITTDPDRMHQLLLNLVSNAIKFTDRGGVEVRVTFEPDRTPDSLVIEVCDSGRGISDEDLQHIFAPFSQLGTSITRSFGGTGLGLAISRHIAEGLGGHIFAASTIGEGSIFRATIDPGSSLASLDTSSFVLAARSPEIVISEEFACLRGTRILLCDNDRTNCELIQLILDEAGADVYTAPNHQTIIDLISEDQDAYDLVLVDLQLPVGDGATSVELLRSSGWHKPVIALVPHSRVDSHLTCLGDGCEGLLTKPVDFDELLRVARDAVSSDCCRFDGSGAARELRANGQLCGAENWPIHPTLPSYQPSLQAEIEGFVETLDEAISEMHSVLDRGDMKQLIESAQWLKDTSDCLGFDCFILPARSLELASRSGSSQTAQKAIHEIQSFTARIELPWRDSVTV